jgi:hypothetical protein
MYDHCTGTYKLKKRKLQSEGFNPASINEPMYFLDAKAGKYVPLTLQLYDDIVKGQLRL